MGQPISGAWANKYQKDVPYTDARVWGTGVNPVHAFRGGPGRPGNAKLVANEMGDRTMAHIGMSQDFIEYSAPWGYQPEDIAGLDVYTPAATQGIPIIDDAAYPAWAGQDGGDQEGQSTPVNRAHIRRESYHPWGMSQMARTALRSIRGGESDQDHHVSNQIPTETVSEGWENKPASGMHEGEYPDDNVTISADGQYIIQTSMVQRKKTLNNDRAMQRGTDEARTSVSSRLAPMKLKVYSGEQRHYDMFPYQIDDMPRAFYYRTAGTGPASYLETNEQSTRQAMQRTPPPDPSMGIPDTEVGAHDETGYTSEDVGYY
jgi:hypothetical protein